MMRQFTTFRLNDLWLGVDVVKVREINRLFEFTMVPHAIPCVRGLLNLRGQVITVFDLAVRLGMERAIITDNSHNIILKEEAVGLIVDSISDILQVEEEAVESPPANIKSIEMPFIEGVLSSANGLVVILSTEAILNYEMTAQNTLGVE